MEAQRLEIARRRQRWLFLAFLLFGAHLAWSLVDIQIRSHPSYLEAAQRQQKKRVVIPPRRGTIYDRNGVALVQNEEQYRIFLVPRNIGDEERFVRDLTAIVPVDEELLRARIGQGGWYVRLPLVISRETARKLELSGIEGVRVEAFFVRNHPYGDLAADLLGRVDVDNAGVEGLELYYDKALRGRPGYAVHQRDALGREYPNFTYPVEAPVDGKDVHLTIDMALQEIAESALAAAVVKARARSGSMVVLDPRTGEVLAMANRGPGGGPAERNYAVVDPFEPGSTFKVAMLAGLYEEGLAAPADSLFCENGVWDNNGRTVRDVHPYGWLTVERVIEESSNICSAKLAQRLGNERFHEYARRYGFGLPTGIDFPGEPRGALKRPEQWSALTATSMAMGYEVMATSLQMAMAYAAIANGGELLRPYLVSRIVGPEGRLEFTGRPQRVRRVVRPETAGLITQALVRVVESGTARNAQLAMLPIAGKTGTAKKTAGGGGGYARGLYTASFVGFFPAGEPRYIAFVRVDEPVGAFYGGSVAAPVFRQTVESSLLTESIASTPDLVERMRTPERIVWTASETFGELPPLPSDTVAPSAVEAASWAAPAVEPPPALDEEPREPYVVDVVTVGRPAEPPYDPRDRVKVPDFAGVSLREAVMRASRLGLRLSFSGNGRVTAQDPEPGEIVARGETVRVVNP